MHGEHICGGNNLFQPICLFPHVFEPFSNFIRRLILLIAVSIKHLSLLPLRLNTANPLEFPLQLHPTLYVLFKLLIDISYFGIDLMVEDTIFGLDIGGVTERDVAWLYYFRVRSLGRWDFGLGRLAGTGLEAEIVEIFAFHS